MSDLIRREELLYGQYVHTECYLQENKDRHLDVYKKGWNDALQAAHDNAPAVDAIEVVRCKDCTSFCGDGMYCDNNILVLYDHFYCYYGERKADETD